MALEAGLSALPFPSGNGSSPTCFVAGTLVATSRGDVAIEDVRIGDRIEAGNLDCDGDELLPDTVGIGLELPNPDVPGDLIQVELARPRSWLREHDLGHSEVSLEMTDIATMGRARVSHVREMVPSTPAPGCLVLMTINHAASHVLGLTFADHSELELTPSHRMFVDDHGQGGWMPAANLEVGMSLRADSGRLQIASIRDHGANSHVYNLEVDIAHTYRVSAQHLWTHNTCEVPKLTAKMKSTSIEIAKGLDIHKVDVFVEKFGGKATLWSKRKTWDSLGREIHYYENTKVGVRGAKWKGDLDPF
jgi:hypothetical protein